MGQSGCANHFSVENPATTDVIATISMGSETDVDRAVAAARAAFDGFSRTSKDDRIALLESIRAVYTRRYDEFGDIISAEMGASRDLAHGAQTAVGIGHLDGVLDALKAMEFAQISPNGDTLLHEAIGVCGPVLAILPFDDEEDAIKIANDTPYGLAAYVQTGDDARARVMPESW